MSEDRAQIETQIRAAWDAGDHERAARLTLEHYGVEVIRFLAARLRSEADAAEVFSMFSEDLWTGLPAFEWRCSMRGWAYTLARNAANRYKVAPHNRAGRHLALSGHSQLSELVERLRSGTRAHHRSEVKSRVLGLREQLPIEDQTLLILRVDRQLPWRELALVMHDGDGPAPEGEELDRVAARLRKRFQAVKDKLRELAIAEGLIADDS